MSDSKCLRSRLA